MSVRHSPFLSCTTLIVITVAMMLGPSAWAQNTFKILHQFTRQQFPEGTLARDSAGNLYGTTSQGAGTGCSGFGCGAVWKLAPNSGGSWTATILHVFSGADGAVPIGGVTLDASGNLYGTTFEGGPSSGCDSYFPGCGVVFRLKPNSNGTWSYKVLHGFSLSDGAQPEGPLTLDSAGNLYGTTGLGGDLSSAACGPHGCGVVFKMTPNSNGTWSETVLHSFTGEDGSTPAGLVLDAHGNLYGTTSTGGPCFVSCDAGVVFILAPNSDGTTWTENVLHAFGSGMDGENPSSTLIFDAAGNLYGTTSSGGVNLGGTVFQLSPDADGTWTERLIHSFILGPVGADGSHPSGLSFDAAGNLYGSTGQGGRAGFGTVFKLSPTSSGWSETIVRTFWGSGKNPSSPILIEPAGHLFGTTLTGTSNFGTVFEITP